MAKTHLLALVQQVETDRQPITVTKRGKPIALIIPAPDAKPRSIFGCMKGTFTVTGDIVGPEPDIWEAMA